MTTANKITIGRMLLIPVFVGCAASYGLSVRDGAPAEEMRAAAIVVFAIASVSDGIDGYLARHFNQRTRLGAILDPIADKSLLLAAIITLSIADWKPGFPLWFPILVVARDVITVSGTLLLNHATGHVEFTTHWIGKTATVLQMTALGWLMLRLEDVTRIPLIVPTALAAIFVALAGFIYVADGFRQYHSASHAQPEPKD